MRLQSKILISLSMLATTAVFGAQMGIPITTVNGTDVFAGPTFMVPATLLPTDVLALTVNGHVNLQGPTAYGTNAAGVLVQAGNFAQSETVGSTATYNGFSFGALLIGTGGVFHQIFPANSANGLNAANPPTFMYVNVPLSSIFGGGVSSGTMMEFRVNDVDSFNNSGSFTLAEALPSPEPATFGLIGSALTGLVCLLRRRR